MDTTLHLIKSRRSVFPRDLSGAEVTRTEVETLLEAANWAPTHARSEPWRYTVVQGGAGVRYTGPIEISYPTNVLYPPPPSEAGPDNHNILIQRAPTRGGRKEGKTGANR